MYKYTTNGKRKNIIYYIKFLFDCIKCNSSKFVVNCKMKIKEAKVVKYGNSKVVRVVDFNLGEKVYIIDEEMKEFIKNKNDNSN